MCASTIPRKIKNVFILIDARIDTSSKVRILLDVWKMLEKQTIKDDAFKYRKQYVHYVY